MGQSEHAMREQTQNQGKLTSRAMKDSTAPTSECRAETESFNKGCRNIKMHATPELAELITHGDTLFPGQELQIEMLDHETEVARYMQ
eukprot:5442988-Amphidinium_carterae.1